MKVLVHYKEPSHISPSDELKSKIVLVSKLEDLNGMFHFIQSVQVITEYNKSSPQFREFKTYVGPPIDDFIEPMRIKSELKSKLESSTP